MRISHRCFVGLVVLSIAVCSAYGLWGRWRLEAGNTAVAIVADFRDVLPLARVSGVSVDEALALLKERGLRGLMVGELTGKDSFNGVGPVALSSAREDGIEGTRLFLDPGFPYFERAGDWLGLRLGSGARPSRDGGRLLPAPLGMLETIGIVPDVEGLEAAVRSGLPIFYRPAPSMGWQTQNAADVLGAVLDAYPVAAVAPSGEIVTGYPDVSGIALESRRRSVPVAMVEFSRQLGAAQLNGLSYPLLLPLHSVTNEELLARNINRRTLLERLVRAAEERSVRLLVLRSAPLGSAGGTLEAYAGEVGALAADLEGRGFGMKWPKPLFTDGVRRSEPPSAFALAAAFLFFLWRYSVRMAGARSGDGPVRLPFLIASLLFTGALALLIRWVPSVPRFVGALAAPLIVTEASLAAMDFGRWRLSWWLSASVGFVLAVVGGLALAAFFSDPLYMLRLRTFSGVKLTLLLPPLLVLLHDLRNRVHPESLNALLSRPPLWGELLLGAVLLGALGIMLFRSDNVQFIPGFEAKVRVALERWLIARPRSKEVFLGYPSLILLAFAVRNGLWTRYREVLRIGVVLGFSSVVNSFCHFHTPIAFILLREFNGLWLGLLLGVALVLAVHWILMPLGRGFRVLAE
ncbi:DUF5693 family protein [Fretibacterium sp. OH1220_COT-178]|uniref:DUF5693 family protein n=1 Tax=Fretibacterium sp. OH1220_COT-178 TaxID=2491047 RepID=UPI000F5DB94A|nr:DUF5693 family protein [Fretibacterium sp. OH1220_COT-178]RRD63552.1 hypothetical protein EII26_10845 [Fretibacterium sp. OH1220_COT-178]